MYRFRAPCNLNDFGVQTINVHRLSLFESQITTTRDKYPNCAGATDFTTRAIPVAAFPIIGRCNLCIEELSSSIFSIHPKILR